MHNTVKTIITLLIAVTLIDAGCTPDTRRIEGTVIKLDFNRIDDVTKSDWIKIDRWKFDHVRTMQEGMEGTLTLPSTYLVVDSMETTGRKVGTPIENRSIGLRLAQHFNSINRNELSEDEPKYKVINPPLISVQGIMKFMKSDSSSITVVVPRDYPVYIEALPLEEAKQ